MSDRTTTRGRSGSSGRTTTGAWTVVGILLAVGIIVPLLVNFYARETPSLFGFPFFYWFQFLLIPIVSGLTFVAFKISQSATARDRERQGLTGSRERER